MKLRFAKLPRYDCNSKKLKPWKCHQLLSFIRELRQAIITAATGRATQSKCCLLGWTLCGETRGLLVLMSENNKYGRDFLRTHEGALSQILSKHFHNFKLL